MRGELGGETGAGEPALRAPFMFYPRGCRFRRPIHPQSNRCQQEFDLGEARPKWPQWTVEGFQQQEPQETAEASASCSSPTLGSPLISGTCRFSSVSAESTFCVFRGGCRPWGSEEDSGTARGVLNLSDQPVGGCGASFGDFANWLFK